MRLILKAYLLSFSLFLFAFQTQAVSFKDLFSIEKLKVLNYLDVKKTQENDTWLRSVTVKIPTQLDIAGLATSQIPFLDISSDKTSEVTFVTRFASEKEADNILSFVDYLNKIPYRSEQIMDNFALGEEIRFKTKLSFLTGVNAVPKLPIAPMALKGNTIITGQFSVIIKKISPTEIELTYTNTNDQEKGLSGNVGTNTNFKFIKIDSQLHVSLLSFFPRFVDFSNADNSTYSRTQSFKIDLSTDEGKSFYNRLLTSSLVTENLKSLLEKRDYTLEQIKRLYVDPYEKTHGVEAKEFGSLSSEQFKQYFSHGWIFKNAKTQSYRRLWYQHQNPHQEPSYFLVDEFQLANKRTHIFGFGSEQAEERIGRALYLANQKGQPIRFIELQLNSALNIKSKNTLKFIQKWQKQLSDNFQNTTETSELIEILKQVSDEKQTVTSEIKFSLKEAFFSYLAESLIGNSSKSKALKQITSRLNSYFDSLPKLRVLTLTSCIGKACDFLTRKQTMNSDLYRAEILSLAESIYELSKSQLSLKEKSQELAELRKNPLFVSYPIGILTSLVNEDKLKEIVAFELTSYNAKTEQTKRIKFGANNSFLSRNLLETIKFLQGETLATSILNRCLLHY